MLHKLLFFTFFIVLNTTVHAENVNIKQISSGMGVIWGMTFISKNKILLTERAGKVGLLNVNTGEYSYLSGLPEIYAKGQGGLLDVATAPQFKQTGWIYFTYSKSIDDEGATTLARAQLHGKALINWTDLLVSQSTANSNHHYGSRIAFDNQGHVFFSVGDRGYRPNAQNLNNHAGSIIRLNLDGSIPQDNPFINTQNALPEIWSYGHRNPQGLAWDNNNQRLWSIEHGPRGGDELNLILKGKNYGWPVISYGKEYWSPFAVGESTHKKGMEQPIKYYVPSIAPSSLMFYNGDAYPKWKGDLFAGALKLRHLNRISLNHQGEFQSEQRLLENLNTRIRALTQDENGMIYFSTDHGDIYRINPQ